MGRRGTTTRRIEVLPPTLRDGVWPLVTAHEMQALDRTTIEDRGIAGGILMESAGRSLIQPILALRAGSSRPEGPVRAICGAGNNGGDGFVAIRHLLAEGIDAEALLLGDPGRLPPDAAANWQRLVAIDAPRRVLDPMDADFDGMALLEETSVAIDALFGTGLQRPIEGGHARWIEWLHQARARGLRVLAVDIPSGISADTGQVLGVAVEADRTVTISLPKIGLTLEPGRSHAGRIEVARIGIEDPDPDRANAVELWNDRAAARRFPERPRAAHKGSFGHVLVVAGSRGMVGAGALCTRACLRAGAGLVTLAHPEGVARELRGVPPEVMTAGVAGTDPGGFARAAEKEIVELMARRDVLALGPGMGRAVETADLVGRVVDAIDKPIVVDADGLNALEGRLDVLRQRSAPTVLTPHPGEAGRLLGIEVAAVNRDRIASARRLVGLSGAVVILKGAGTVVAGPDGRALVVPTGGPLLASGGTGDVLTGIVAALLAAGGRSAFEAAGLAAWWHGASADRSPRAALGWGLLASEVADGLPDCAAEIVASGATRGKDEELVLRFP